MLSGYIKTLIMDYAQSFEKGMVQDFRDQPEGTYYSSTDFDSVGPEGSIFSLRSKKGNKLLFQVTPGFRPISGCGVLNKIVIFSAYDGLVPRPAGLNNGEIGVIIIDPDDFTCTYDVVYNHQRLNFLTTKQIESLLFPENGSREGSYWTDNNNPPRTINIYSKIYNTPIGLNALQPNKKYMVASGMILYNGITYGSTTVSPTPNPGNTIFDTTGGPLNYTPLTLQYKVIEYYPVELLDWTPKAQHGSIRLSKPIPGNAKCGSYTFFYQQIDNEGAVLSWSQPSFPIRFAGPTSTGSMFRDYALHQGHLFDRNSSQGAQLILEGLDPRYQRVRIAAVFSTDFHVYESPVVVYDGPLVLDTNGDFYFDYTGSELVSQLLEEDLLQVNSLIERVKSITSVNNILFPANIRKGKDVSWDPSTGAQIKCVEYSLLTDVIGNYPRSGFGNDFIFNGHAVATNPILPGAVYSRIWPKQFYMVKGPSGSFIDYCGVIYNPGDVFQGLQVSVNPTAETFTPTGNATVKAVLRIQLYVDGITPKYRYVELENDFYDGKGMTVNHYLQSLWREERYRYSLVLYDTAGNIGYARWIGDKTVPAQYFDAFGGPSGTDVDPDTGQTYPFSFRLIENLGSSYNQSPRFLVKHIGVEFNNINFQGIADELGIQLSELGTYFNGFSIFRCERDASIVAQGMMKNTFITGFSPPSGYNAIIEPMAGGMNANRNDPPDYINTQGVYAFYSPDFQMRFNGLPSFNDVDFASPASYVAEDGQNMPNRISALTSNRHWISKYYVDYSNIYRNLINSPSDIDKANSVPEVESGGSAGAGSQYFQNLTHLNNIDNGGGNIQADGTAVRCTVLKLINNNLTELTNQYSFYWPIINLKKRKTVFYGGDGTSAKAANLYYPTGHYQPFNAEFITSLVNNGGKANGIHVYGGDAHVGFHTINRVFEGDNSGSRYAWTDIFPVEANVNFHLRDGLTANKDRYFFAAGNTGWEQFLVNPAYSNDYLTAGYPAVPDLYTPINEYQYRALFSLKKTPGELIDSFRRFLPENFRDVSSLNGPITNVKAKAMKLFYWQENAVGYLPVNERAAISSSIGSALIIGEGGVLQRYDERTNYYGNQHQWSLTETDEGFCWIDAKKRALCFMNVGMEIIPLETAKGMMTFLNRRIRGRMLKEDNPIAGAGISSIYDPEMRTVLFTLRDGLGSALTFGFTPYTQQFTGFRKAAPGLYYQWGKHVLSFSPVLNDVVDALQPQNYIVGDQTVSLIDGNYYICIAAYTQTVTGDPSNDSVHWTVLHRCNEIWLHNYGDISQYYREVFESDVIFKVHTDEKTMEKVFDNFNMRGTKEWFDVLAVSTSSQVATDNDIQKHPDYEFRNKAWLSSVPLDDNSGRMQDFYLIVHLKKDNRLNGSPVQSKNETVILSSVITTYRKAY